jgi:hypothetical protein
MGARPETPDAEFIAARLRGLSEITKALYLGYEEAIAQPGLDPARMFNALSEELAELADHLAPDEDA